MKPHQEKPYYSGSSPGDFHQIFESHPGSTEKKLGVLSGVTSGTGKGVQHHRVIVVAMKVDPCIQFHRLLLGLWVVRTILLPLRGAFYMTLQTPSFPSFPDGAGENNTV